MRVLGPLLILWFSTPALALEAQVTGLLLIDGEALGADTALTERARNEAQRITPSGAVQLRQAHESTVCSAQAVIAFDFNLALCNARFGSALTRLLLVERTIDG